MRKLLASLILALLPAIALGQTSYNQFEPGGALSGTWNSQNVNLAAGSSFITGLLPIGNGGLGTGPITGIVKGTGVGYGAAGVSDILGLFSGTCSATTVLHGGGACGQVSLTADVTGTLPMGNGGLGATSFTANDVLLGNGGSPFSVLALGADTLLHGTGAAPNALSVPNCGSGTTALAYSTTSHTFSCQTISVGAGTITSITLAAPAWLTWTGSPCTSGACSFTLASATSVSPNEVLASPNGVSGALAPRQLVGADIPAINIGAAGNGGVFGLLPATTGGTGWANYTIGDTLYADTTTSLARLAGNTTTTKKFLTQTGTGTGSAAPTWGTISTADVPAPGATTDIVFNSGGALAASGSLAFDGSNIKAGNNIGFSSLTTLGGLGVLLFTDASNNGIVEQASSTGGDFTVQNQSTTGALKLGAGGAIRAGVSAAGNWSFNLPSSGPVVTVAGQQAGTQVDVSPDEATFTITGNGFTVAPTATAIWHRIGHMAFLEIESPGITGTSNATTFSISGIPAYAQPATLSQECVIHVVNNGSENPAGSLSVTVGSGTWNVLLNGSTTGWTASGSKGWGVQVCTYFLN